MRTIRLASFISIDGVMQGPGGPDEDTTGGFGFGGWVWPHFDETSGGLMGEAMGQDYDLLLGRRTYEIFAAYWPTMDDEIGRTFNAVNKYVAAGPETPMSWAHSHRLEGGRGGGTCAEGHGGARSADPGLRRAGPRAAGGGSDRRADHPHLPDHPGAGKAAVRRRLQSPGLDAGEEHPIGQRRGGEPLSPRRRGPDRLLRRTGPRSRRTGAP